MWPKPSPLSQNFSCSHARLSAPVPLGPGPITSSAKGANMARSAPPILRSLRFLLLKRRMPEANWPSIMCFRAAEVVVGLAEGRENFGAVITFGR